MACNTCIPITSLNDLLLPTCIDICAFMKSFSSTINHIIASGCLS